MKVLSFVLTSVFWTCQSAVLDPSLYLAPSPPLTSNLGLSAENQWSTPLEVRVEREADYLDNLKVPTTTEASDPMESAETFWPMFRTSGYSLRGVHIPLTFSVSGAYGNYPVQNPGVIGSSYASVSADDSDSDLGGTRFSNAVSGDSSNLYALGKTLAGSSYGSYGNGYPGTRIYSGNNGASWSGWGNGKWGHYGKG